MIAVSALVACAAEVPASAPPLPPRAPSGLVARSLLNGVHLSWINHADDEDGLEIERKSVGEFSRIASVAPDIFQTFDGAVSPGQTYAYRVRAIRGSEPSAYSNEVALAIGPRVDRPDAGALDAGSSTAAVSFRRDIIPILRQSCGSGDNGCHSRVAYIAVSSMDCRGWLSLEDRPLGSIDASTGASTGCPDRGLHARLVDLTAWLCEPPVRYAAPGSLAESLLFGVIGDDPALGGACNRGPGRPLGPMPPVGSGYRLPAASARLIAAWIESGARDD